MPKGAARVDPRGWRRSTMACSIVAAKLVIPVAHVEADLRSFDRTMPEEINRVVTDSLASLLFTTSRDANENLEREGIDPSKTHFVGNVMIDTLLKTSAESHLPENRQTKPVRACHIASSVECR